MLYVKRDEDGEIIALQNDPESGADEQKSMMDEEVLKFLQARGDAETWVQLLSLSDIGIARILEDLIDLLIKKSVILFTDLPEQAQAKINERKQLREKIEPNQLVVDDIL